MHCDKQVAILMATYNGERYIKQQLDSLLNQSYKDFNIYIHDDGSKDNTTSIINDYSENYRNIIIIPSKSNIKKGSLYNFLYLLNEIEADYYMFCDQDDIWNVDKIEILINEIVAHERESNVPLLVFADSDVVDEDLRVISHSFMKFSRLSPRDRSLEKTILSNSAPGCNSVFNRKARDLAVLVQNKDNLMFHDWWISLVVAATGESFYIEKSLMLYRQHGKNVIGANNDKGLKDVKKYVKLLFKIKQIYYNNHEWYRNCIKQAFELKSINVQNEDNRKMINELSKFDSFSKLAKIRLFRKYGIHRGKRELMVYLFL